MKIAPIIHLGFALALLACTSSSQRTSTTTSPPRTPRPAELWVSGYNSNAVHRFDPKTGDLLGLMPGINGAQSIRGGRGGYSYIVEEKVDKVLRYRGTTLDSEFVADDPDTPQDETGGLQHPTAAIFGPDGNLYVAAFNGDNVLRYNGETGAFIDEFVPAGSGGLDGPDAGMIFGPDGHLYVPSFNSGDVLRYDGSTGAFIDAIIPAGRGGLQNPRVILFRPRGRIFVTSWGSHRINEYTKGGLFVRRVANVVWPTGMAPGPDGFLYVTSDQSNSVSVVDPETGAVSTLIPKGSGIQGGTFTAFVRP